MKRLVIKGLKRCPSCNSANIYRRVRIIQMNRDRKRKANFKIIERRVRQYRCHVCKYEFDNPVVM